MHTAVSKKINYEELSPYSRECLEIVANDNDKKVNKNYSATKLTSTFEERKEYLCHGLNLKLPEKCNITVSLPYNRTSKLAHKLIRETYKSIQELFPTRFKDNLICAYKRNKNIGDYLVSSKLK